MSSVLNKYFDNIYCLNLKSRPDKWEQSRKRLLKNNVVAERFKASSYISPRVKHEFKQLKKKFPNENVRKKKAIINQVGAMGCLLSHIRIIKDAKEKGYQKILILEDDFIFAKDFIKLFKTKQSKISGWKLLYLGGTQHSWKNIKINNGFYHPINTCGTFAYAVDSSIYDSILKDYEKKLYPVDHCLILGAQKKFHRKSYVFFPNIIIADLTDSDIRGPRDQRKYSKRLQWDKIAYEY